MRDLRTLLELRQAYPPSWSSDGSRLSPWSGLDAITEDEGHRVETLTNRVDVLERASAFLDEVLEPAELAPIR